MQVELLEARRHLSAAVAGATFEDGTLSITGTARRDNVGFKMVQRWRTGANRIVRSDCVVTVGRATYTYVAADIKRVVARLGDGDDTLYFADTTEFAKLVRRGGQIVSVPLDVAFEAYGENGDDRMWGLNGRQLLDGGPGDDTLDGGAGKDVLIGGEGDDYIVDEAGDDLCVGGAGDDYFEQRPAADGRRADRDTFDGGAGDDVLVQPAATADRQQSIELNERDPFEASRPTRFGLVGGTTNVVRRQFGASLDPDVLRGLRVDGSVALDGDVLTIIGTGAADAVRVRDRTAYDAAADRIERNDLVVSLNGRSFKFPIGSVRTVVARLGDGDDRMDFDGLGHVFHRFARAPGRLQQISTPFETRVFGEAGDDVIDGFASTQYINGGSGDDTLDGGAAGDVLIGGGGDDIVVEDPGDDLLFTGDGDDRVVRRNDAR